MTIINRHAMKELKLYLLNDYSHVQQVIDNLSIQGYSVTVACRMWQQLVDDAARRYGAEFGHNPFDEPTRQALARELECNYFILLSFKQK